MGKRQYRRTVSLRPERYLEAEGLARGHGLSISAYLERLVEADRDLHGHASVTKAEAKQEMDSRASQRQAREAQDHGQYFTW